MTFGDRFLEFPDLFPARQSGEAWGSGTLALDFVGGPYLFVGLSEAQSTMVRRRYGELCSLGDDATKGAITSRLFKVASNEFKAFDLHGWNYDLDLAHQPDSVLVAGLGFIARLDYQEAFSGGLWTALASSEEFLGVFENYLRILVAYRLLDCGGALLHSAGVVDSEEVHLFYGFSGAGKSTISRLGQAEERLILSDDLNPVVLVNGQPMAAGLPFWGDLEIGASKSTPRPVRALSRLQKGESTSWSPMTKSQGVASLLACSPYVNSDPYRRERLHSNLESIIGLIPAGELTFAKHSSFNEILRCIGISQ
jgi:hypothetical protein